MNECFWTHINRTTYCDIPEIIFSFNGESEVCQFIVIFCKEDVGGFDISMNDSFRCQVVECLKYRQYNLIESVNRKGGMLLKELVEVSSFTKLSDDVAVIDAEVNVLAFDDVRM